MVPQGEAGVGFGAGMANWTALYRTLIMHIGTAGVGKNRGQQCAHCRHMTIAIHLAANRSETCRSKYSRNTPYFDL